MIYLRQDSYITITQNRDKLLISTIFISSDNPCSVTSSHAHSENERKTRLENMDIFIVLTLLYTVKDEIEWINQMT